MNLQTAWCVLVAALTLGGPVAVLPAAEPVRVAGADSSLKLRQPQAAVNQQGVIFVAMGAENRLYCCRSSDAGLTYGDPVLVGQVSQLALGMRRGPRIAADGKTVAITAIDHACGNLLAWRSADAGDSWQGPVVVNRAERSAREGLHGMAQGPDGFLYCVWLDLRGTGTEIYGASSTDGGGSWSENRRIYASPSGTVCECCNPSVAGDSQGGIYVMWRNEIEGDRDMFACFSRDQGVTFSKARKLGEGSWKLNACPMDGGHLAASAPGKVTTVWRRDHDLFRTTTGEPTEQKLGAGMQPWVVGNSDGVWLAWITQRGGELLLSAPDALRPISLDSQASDPMLASALGGKGPIVAVWESGNPRQPTIMAAVVSP
ncbi:sialidase family protein [Lignipirellula cremea]|uniref:BNR/Asp-box repeat protein n=1 Tax=Lignipirellula cremea TaxID=2528010 RepID=A0A518DKZ9_9BACT|nr:sialidase family protein [Lignipirellula cremea]QDU92496.1 hypothetical protein Pla8534_02440 [Lignipirellula cremea]